MDVQKLATQLDSLSQEECEVINDTLTVIETRLGDLDNQKTLTIPYKSFPTYMDRFTVDKTLKQLETQFNILIFLGHHEPSVPDACVQVEIPNKRVYQTFSTIFNQRMEFTEWIIISKLKFNPKNGEFVYGNVKGKFTVRSKNYIILNLLVSNRGNIVTHESMAKELFPRASSLTAPAKDTIKTTIRHIKERLGILPKKRTSNKDIIICTKKVGYEIL